MDVDLTEASLPSHLLGRALRDAALEGRQLFSLPLQLLAPVLQLTVNLGLPLSAAFFAGVEVRTI